MVFIMGDSNMLTRCRLTGARLWKWAIVWLCAMGVMMAGSLPASAMIIFNQPILPPTTSGHPFIAVGTLHRGSDQVIEFRVQESIKGEMSGNYQIVSQGHQHDPSRWAAHYQDGERLVLLADDVVENKIYKTNKFLVLPSSTGEPQIVLFPDLKVDAVEEATRALVALEQAKSAEAAHTVFRKMVTSPTPFVRYMTCWVQVPQTLVDILPDVYDRHMANIAYILPLLNDPNLHAQGCVVRRLLRALPHSVSIVAAIRVLNTSPTLQGRTIYYATQQILSKASENDLPRPRITHEKKAPELTVLLTEWWSENRASMLAEDGEKLIPALESNSPVARWYAVTLLTEMAGTDHGFDPNASKKKRAKGVARWQAWLEELQEQAAAQAVQ